MGRKAQPTPAPRNSDLEHIGGGQPLDDAAIEPALLFMLRRHLEKIRSHRPGGGDQFLHTLIAESALV
jgi:hypothetical protein